MGHSRRLATLVLAVIMAGPASTAMEDRTSHCLDFDIATPEVVAVPGKTQSGYRMNANAIEIDNAGSIGFFVLQVPDALAGFSAISWRWARRGDTLSAKLSERRGDDRYASIMLGVASASQTASLADRIKRRMLELNSGVSFPEFVIEVAWAGAHRVGEAFRSPYYGERHVVLVARGGDATETAYDEYFDVADLGRTAGLGAVIDVESIAFFADTDATSAQTEISIESVCLHYP